MCNLNEPYVKLDNGLVARVEDIAGIHKGEYILYVKRSDERFRYVPSNKVKKATAAEYKAQKEGQHEPRQSPAQSYGCSGQ